MTLKEKKIILGIDPGSLIMGYGLIEISGKEIRLLDMGILKLSKGAGQSERLKSIFHRTLSLIEQYQPDEFSIEAPFYGKNVQSMLKLGRSQGVAIAAALWKNIPVFEYSPLEIKKSITGNGSASKEQVAAMLSQLIRFDQPPETLDATDGLAAAVCHYLKSRHSTQTPAKHYKSWKAFIADHPGRINNPGGL